MNLTLKKQALTFIASQQQPSGSFYGQASLKLQSFEPLDVLPTIFFTSLIVGALHKLSEASDINIKACKYLLKNKGPKWSWNYWPKNHPINQSRPYPDDLDDTCCALIALQLIKPKVIDGQCLAHLGQLLISAEKAPGGPYRTWLVPAKLQDSWSDIDVAVNANIGHCLALNKVSVPGLDNFIDQAIKNNKLQSPYYVGKIPLLYFLSRWYKGGQLNQLRRAVIDELKKPEDHNSLMLSLLITASVNLGLSPSWLRPCVKRLLVQRQTDHWPAEALYIDLTSQAKTLYGGSAALTTALALEALHGYEQPPTKPTLISKPVVNLPQIIGYSPKLSNKALERLYKTYIKRIVIADKQLQIVEMASLTASAYGASINSTRLRHLNLASINGWVAYTIYDDFLDDEGKAQNLGVANVALRQTVWHFGEALSDNKFFNELVGQTLNDVDSANHWEVTHARGQLNGNNLTINKLPAYKNYSQLYQRSSGHMLAACGVVMLMNLKNQQQELNNLQQFFYHYLIARQLNDDAHDWQEDLSRGHLSSAVVLLLSQQPNYQNFGLDKNIKSLRLDFWQHTIRQLANKINYHCLRARYFLGCCNMADRSQHLSWIEGLEQAVNQAMSSRRQASKFIKTYQTNSL